MQAGRLPGSKTNNAGQVDNGRGRDEQRLFTDETCRQSLINDLAAGQVDRAALHHALVVEGLSRIDSQCATGFYAACVDDHRRVDRDVTARVAAVVGFDARSDGPRVSDFARVDLDPLACRQALLVDQLAGGAHVNAARIGFAGHFDARCIDVKRTLRRGLRHVQVTVGVYLNIAATGSHIACRLYADTLFGADQLDRVGVHTAKRRGINGQLRLVGGIGSTLCGRQRVGVDVVGTGDDVELFCVDIGVDLRRTGDQIELVDCACIQASAIDRDAAAVHGKMVEFAVRIEYRFASAEGDARRVDKAATAAGDAIRVGNDHAGCLPGHLGVPIQLAGVGAGHFVEDGACGAPA